MRCDAMVHHARVQIHLHGIEKFSVNEVLRHSGGSKATVAKYFGDRNGLIAAAVGAEAREAVAVLSHGELSGRTVRDSLHTAMKAILTFYLSPGAIAFYRAVIRAADPKGATAFYNEGHLAIINGLASLLESHKDRGLRQNLDCRDAADQLVHAIRAGLYEQALIGLTNGTPDDGAIEERVTRTLDLLLPGLLDHK